MPKFKNLTKQTLTRSVKDPNTYPNLLSIVAFALIIRRALVQFDFSWDARAYHLPFASKLANIYPDGYTIEPFLENRFDGFPLLMNLVQGILWRLGGDPRFANLLNVSCLIFFVAYVSRRYQLHPWKITLSLLSVPLILIHSYKSYIDLATNVFLSLAFLVLFDVLDNKRFQKRDLFLFFLFGGIAANSKYNIVGVYALLCIAMVVVLYWVNEYKFSKKLLRTYGFCLVLLLITTFSYSKNLVAHQNPFYPQSVDLFGAVQFDGPDSRTQSLNSSQTDLAAIPVALRGEPIYKLFAYSVLEIDLYSDNSGQLFSVDQSNRQTADSRSFKMGGFMVLNLLFWSSLILVTLVRTRSKRLVGKVAVLGAAVALVAMSPGSWILRYWLFIPMVLASVAFVSLEKLDKPDLKLLSYVFQACLLLISLRFTHDGLLQNRPNPINVTSYILTDEDQSACIEASFPEAFMYRITNEDFELQTVQRASSCSLDYLPLD